MRDTRPSVGRRLWYTAVVMSCVLGILLGIVLLFGAMLAAALLLFGPEAGTVVFFCEIVFCAISLMVYLVGSGDHHYYNDSNSMTGYAHDYAADRMWERTAWVRNGLVRIGKFMVQPLNR